MSRGHPAAPSGQLLGKEVGTAVRSRLQHHTSPLVIGSKGMEGQLSRGRLWMGAGWGRTLHGAACVLGLNGRAEEGGPPPPVSPMLPPSPSPRSTRDAGIGLKDIACCVGQGRSVGCRGVRMKAGTWALPSLPLTLCAARSSPFCPWKPPLPRLQNGDPVPACCQRGARWRSGTSISGPRGSEKSILRESRLLEFCNVISALPPGMGPADIPSLRIALSAHPSCQLSFPPFSPSTLGTASLEHVPSEHLAGGAVIHAPPAGFVASPPARVCKTFLAWPCSRD